MYAGELVSLSAVYTNLSEKDEFSLDNFFFMFKNEPIFEPIFEHCQFEFM